MANLTSLGILGCGNMGGAILRGILASKSFSPSSLFLLDRGNGHLDSFLGLGVNRVSSLGELFEKSSGVLLAVKPQVFRALSLEVHKLCGSLENKTMISVMAGLSTRHLCQLFPSSFKIVRVMPNLGLAVQEGASAMETDGIAEETLDQVEKLFSGSGKMVRVSGSQMNAVTGLSGSGPMYFFEFLDGLTEAGVEAGLDRTTAYSLALQTVKGSLKLLETSEDTPANWTARVCSPAGTTLSALQVLVEGEFKPLIRKAVLAAAHRSQELSQS